MPESNTALLEDQETKEEVTDKDIAEFFDKEKAAKEYTQVHLNSVNKKDGIFRRIANWFLPNKMKGITFEKGELSDKIGSELLNLLNKTKDPNQLQLELERRGIQMSLEDIKERLLPPQTRGETPRQTPLPANRVQRHPQTRPMR